MNTARLKPAGDQMLDQAVHRRRVVAGDGGGEHAERGAVVQHDRHALRARQARRVSSGSERARDDAVHVKGEEIGDAGRRLRVLRHGAEQHAVAGCLDLVG